MDTPLAWYTTREAVKAALDVKTTARSDREVDRCIAAASRTVEGALHRRFYPWTGTKYFNWPDCNSSSYRIDFDEHGLVTATLVLSGGVEVVVGSYFLEPANDGPPYDSLELDLGDGSGFTGGDTWQRSIAITGLWGYTLDERAVGTVAEAVDGSETAVDVSAGVAVAAGVGSVIRIGNERMTVTGRRLMSTGTTVAVLLSDSKNSTSVTVADGSSFEPGEVITIGAERMLVQDIAGNVLLVQRAFDGTVLAQHSIAATVYASRTFIVQRGALGTTAATADSGATVLLWYPPGLVEEFTVAQALVYLGQRQAGYARTVGEGENQRESSGRGLMAIAKDARRAHGRMARSGAV